MKKALVTLDRAVEVSLGLEYRSNPTEIGFALIFARAEHEALLEMITEIEGLLILCRRLFGTASWLDPKYYPVTGTESISSMADWQ